MTKQTKGTSKPWVPLGDPMGGFDQTNGVVDLGEAESGSAGHGIDETDLLARGVASNAASMGLSGGF